MVTLIFVVIVVVGSMLLGLIAAVLCNKAIPGIRFFSTSYALPMAIASSSAAMIFKIILNPTIGILNKFLQLDINWIADPKYALLCVAVLTAWLNSGINFLYFSAGLANIDESIYERASVDGASAFSSFQPDPSGLKPDYVLYAGGKYHWSLPVLRPGQASDPGRPWRIHQPHRVFHLPGCVL